MTNHGPDLERDAVQPSKSDSSAPSFESYESSESSESVSIASETVSLLSPRQDVVNYKSTPVAIESSPLLPPATSTRTQIHTAAYAIIPLLLVGVFLSNADGSIVLATYGLISSTFHSFSDASWLTTSFSLATCAVQPLTGKLSDVYGRKNILLFSYLLFAIGMIFWLVTISRSRKNKQK